MDLNETDAILARPQGLHDAVDTVVREAEHDADAHSTSVSLVPAPCRSQLFRLVQVCV